MSFFFNKKIDPIPGAGSRQLAQAGDQFSRRIEFLDLGQFDGCQLTEVPAFLMMPPALEQTGGRHSGFSLQ